MTTFNEICRDGVCEVCGNEDKVVVTSSSIYPMSFSTCKKCMIADVEPYNILVAFVAERGSWPFSVSKFHQSYIRNSLSNLNKTEEEFARDVFELSSEVSTLLKRGGLF